MSLKYKYVLFCEDIRQEIGGKVSLMGVLGSKLLTQQFPIGFPKLCLFIEWEDLVGKANIAVNILPPEGTDIGYFSPHLPTQNPYVPKIPFTIISTQFT